MNEFDLIRGFFQQQQFRHEGVICGIGDDAAILQVPKGQQLLISVDTLVADVHFRSTDPAVDIGYKSLAVNLSDMAAMGATPAWVTLSLALPEIDERWLRNFCIGFFSLAQEHRVQLIGGDTTRGPLTITVQIHGFAPAGKALRRSGARVGDKILVSGNPGDAALALQLGNEKSGTGCDRRLLDRLRRPTPRVREGLALRNLANSAIDISDGLLADLGHIMTASGTAAHINCASLPLSAAMQEQTTQLQAWQYALSGGDDYELCFTVAADKLDEVLALNREFESGFTVIGEVEAGQGIRCLDADGRPVTLARDGYQHFQSAG